MLSTFDLELIEWAYKAYHIPEEIQRVLAIYPMPDINLNLKQIRKWVYNFIVDRATTSQEGELAEFIQGRASEKVGTRNYRFKVRAGAKFYYDKILEPMKSELRF